MPKTAGGAYRHVRELGELFRDVNTVGVAIVEELLKRHDQKKYLRQSLRRLQERGLIQKREQNYTLTSSGTLFFLKHFNRERGRIKKDHLQKWDGKWRLVSFDVPVKDDKKRRMLRDALRELNFYQLQKSVWIAPFEISERFWKFTVMNDLNQYCKVMLIQVLEGDEELKGRFRLH